MMPPPFPNQTFAWVFLGLLLALAWIAAWIDFRSFKIPKTLTLTMLGCGLALNLVRGGWLGAQERSTFVLDGSNVAIGLLDGFLFSLAGFALGFACFFVLFAVGAVGGGDVKLFAAVGAWVGAYYSLWLLAGSTLLLIVFAFFRVATSVASHGPLKAVRASNDTKKPLSRFRTYSLTVAIAAAVMLTWFWRVPLGLAEPAPRPSLLQTVQHEAR
jgi:Flp pilus assembly protein protease CpaA